MFDDIVLTCLAWCRVQPQTGRRTSPRGRSSHAGQVNLRGRWEPAQGRQSPGSGRGRADGRLSRAGLRQLQASPKSWMSSLSGSATSSAGSKEAPSRSSSRAGRLWSTSDPLLQPPRGRSPVPQFGAVVPVNAKANLKGTPPSTSWLRVPCGSHCHTHVPTAG